MQDELKRDEELQEEVEQIEEAADKVEHPIHDVQESVEEAVKAEPHQELPKRLEEQPKQIGAPVPGRMARLKAFMMECQRVLRVTKKPPGPACRMRANEPRCWRAGGCAGRASRSARWLG